MGTLGEALFFGALFLLGLAALASLIISQVINPQPELWRPGVGFWLMFVTLVSFVLIGGGRVIYAALQLGISAERRSAMVRRASQIDLLSETLPSPKDFPTIPRDVNLTNSPGIRLKYRLPMTHTHGWTLTAAAIVALSWNGIASVLSAWALNSHVTSHPEWFLSIFLIPFWGVGVWLARSFFYQLWLRTVLGPSTVEISALPLFPGSRFEIYLAQAGRVLFQSLELALVCEEETTYHQGTDVRTECRVVYHHPVASWEKLRIEPQEPFEHACSLQIPERVMHSFHSAHNGIHWKLVVSGKSATRATMARSFPLLVYPVPARTSLWNR